MKFLFNWKTVLLIALTGLMASTILYFSLKNRYQAIIKTTLLQQIGVLKKEWITDQTSSSIHLFSPTFWVDGLYKSMEGPKSTKPVQITTDQKLIWLKGFSIAAFDPDTGKPLSNDFICHMNLDLFEQNYYSAFNLPQRIGQWYPRITSLSHGQEEFNLPQGFGFPIMGNEILYVTTQTLNHNYPSISQNVQHRVTMNYSTAQDIKPVMMRAAYIQLPYEWSDLNKVPLDRQAELCLPVDMKNHSYVDAMGNKISGHWRIPPGKNTYRSEVSDLLKLKDSVRLHAANVHVHPFAEKITLRNKTTNRTLFESLITNYSDKIGMRKVDAFSSEEGLWMNPDHIYELVLEVNNTSAVEQDMMGSMFLFFYDAEMDQQLKKMGLK